jgi:hypothetical protein
MILQDQAYKMGVAEHWLICGKTMAAAPTHLWIDILVGE